MKVLTGWGWLPETFLSEHHSPDPSQGKKMI